jgi:hypothetical protein
MAKSKKKPTRPEPQWLKHAWWIIPAIAILVYFRSFSAGFTLDDIPIIEDNMLIRTPATFSELWTSHYWSGKIDASDTGLYRPLTLSTYAIQYWMNSENPVPYHILNIFLHALTCFVLMKYAGYLFKDMRITALAGLFFAIHPLHTEAVAGLVGRAELMAALFILLAGISYHLWRTTGAYKWLGTLVLSTFAAIASKEHGFMIVFILGLQELLYTSNSKKQPSVSSRRWIGLGVALAISALMFIIHNNITGPAKPHEQWLAVSAGDRMATAVRTTIEYIGLHVFPFKLSADYWSTEVPVARWTDPSVLLGLFVSILLVASAIWQRNKMKSYSWGIMFFFLTLAPVSNFFFAAGFLKAERILYIPSIGIIMAIAGLLVRLVDLKPWRLLSNILMVLLSVFFIIRTVMRTGDWENNYTLATATLRTSPSSPRFNNMMGLELRGQKRNEEALIYFEKAVQSNPNHVPALVNLGTEYKNFNRLEEAAATLEKALATDPGTMMTYVNLMAVYREMKNFDKNLEIAQLALERFPQSAPILWNAGNAYHLKGDLEKANELRAKAREIQPDIMK